MHPQAHGGMPLQVLRKGQVRLLVGALQHFLEIAFGLMRVDQKYEMKFRWHVASLAREATS